jgi:hypothetical protein
MVYFFETVTLADAEGTGTPAQRGGQIVEDIRRDTSLHVGYLLLRWNRSPQRKEWAILAVEAFSWWVMCSMRFALALKRYFIRLKFIINHGENR